VKRIVRHTSTFIFGNAVYILFSSFMYGCSGSDRWFSRYAVGMILMALWWIGRAVSNDQAHASTEAERRGIA
jgi:hypothetical protein